MKKIVLSVVVILAVLIGARHLSSHFKKGIPAKGKRLNVVIILIDALRPDHLGCYGYRLATSPHIDAFAKEGVLFESAFSQGPATRISVPTLFTSFYPSVHRIFTIQDRLPDEFLTLPEVLKRNGYNTAAFVAKTSLKKDYNLDQGFDAYDDSHQTSDEDIAAAAAGWLKDNRDRPFFLYLHYMGVHAPYVAPAPYNTLFWQEAVSDTIKEFVKQFSLDRNFDPFRAGMYPDERMTAYLISQYDGKIRQSDDFISFFLKKLDELGLSKNTIVILLSDHGEEFKEHGNFFHSHDKLYDELIRIPLIMRLPGTLPKNKRINKIVRAIDIMPTILDILKITKPNLLQGTSIIPFIKGITLRNFDSFSEGGNIKAVRTDRYKLIERYHPHAGIYDYELYDLEKDPRELTNIAGTKPGMAQKFKKKLNEYRENNEKTSSALGRDTFGNRPVKLDEESRQYLKSLGYIQ